MKYIVRKVQYDNRNNLCVVVDFYIPIKGDVNAFGFTPQKAFLNDPQMEGSRAALFAKMTNSVIMPVQEGHVALVSQVIGLHAENAKDPDKPTQEEIEKICSKRLAQIGVLINQQISKDYMFAGLSGEVSEV